MTQSIKRIKASDGTGNASTPTVTTIRSALATTLKVNTVTGIYAGAEGFYAIMGTPHTFTDPVTGEVITEISEATAVEFQGHLNVGDIIIDAIMPGYTDAGSKVGDIVIIRPTTGWANNVSDVLAVAHNDDGTLKAVTASPGWTAVTGATLAYSANNGQKEYVLSSTLDLTSILSPGMRFSVTRSTTPPAQCMAFTAASSQYASKASAVGITFTNTFSAESWTYVNSYTGNQAQILARIDGTNGWLFGLTGSGQIQIDGRSSAQDRTVTSFQSVPLKRWVHIAVSLTASTGVGAIYLNGALIPSTPSGSNTAITQSSGALTLGQDQGTRFFDGYLSEVRLWSAVIPQSQVQSNMAISLTGSETNLIGLWQGNGNFNDKTTNANNMTATNGAIATQAANPYNTIEYGIITKVTSSQITLFTGTDYNIPNQTLNTPQYSNVKVPYGFPAARGKWRVNAIFRSLQSLSASTLNVWNNITSTYFSVPTGEWTVGHSSSHQTNSISGDTNVQGTLSTANNTESDPELTGVTEAASVTVIGGTFTREKSFSLSAPTTFYLNTACSTASAGFNTLLLRGDKAAIVLQAECAYI